MSKLPPSFEITVKKLVPSGEGLGYYKKRPIFVYGALPNETVEVVPLKVSKRKTRAKVAKVAIASSLRREPKEDHFLCCSPWQIIPEGEQLSFKQEFAKKLFMDNARGVPLSELEIERSPAVWNYRNKMEFSFAANDEGCLSLAFHERFRHSRLRFLEECALAHRKINQCAAEVVGQLRTKKIPLADLKNLLVRYSHHENRCLAVLYVKKEKFSDFSLNSRGISGWMIVYSNPESPAALATKVLFQEGRDYLIEMIRGIRLKYYYNGFFQINPLAFSEVIDYLKGYIDKADKAVDLYAGAGTVGICLASGLNRVVSIEFDGQAADAAKDNADKNNIKNITVISGAAEKQELDKHFQSADLLLVDPPRSGLHPKVVRRICESGPKKFIYISCNPLTQSREFRFFKEIYRVVGWKLFDLYPQTPHVESVIIMERAIK